MAEKAVARHKVSIALACRTFGVSETCYRYGPKLKAENEEIADLLVGLTDAGKTWGFGLCFLHLRNVKGHPWNHKRVHRIYCELELNLRIKPVAEFIKNRAQGIHQFGALMDQSLPRPEQHGDGLLLFRLRRNKTHLSTLRTQRGV